MSISSLLKYIHKHPDDINAFDNLFIGMGRDKHSWIYREKCNRFSFSDDLLSILSWLTRDDMLIGQKINSYEQNYIEFNEPSNIYLSNIHFGIHTEGLWNQTITRNTPELLSNRAVETISIDKAIVVCEQHCSNYAHFQLYTMLRLYDLINKFGDLSSFTIIIDDPLIPNHYRTDLINLHPLFNSLNFTHARNRNIKVNKLIAPSMNQLTDNSILKQLWSSVSVKSDLQFDKIYIERRTSLNGSEYRKVVNTNDRDAWLFKNNFKIFYMEDLNIEEEISLFRNAKIVVGVIGAALVNIVHMNPGTLVVELHHNEFNDNSFLEMAIRLNINYIKLPCLPPIFRDNAINLEPRIMPLVCDFNQLDSILRKYS